MGDDKEEKVSNTLDDIRKAAGINPSPDEDSKPESTQDFGSESDQESSEDSDQDSNQGTEGVVHLCPGFAGPPVKPKFTAYRRAE
jgi:hypothetical protein